MISQSQNTAEAAQDILEGRSRGRVAQLIVFMGPAFIACVAYMDPGNFAANIQGGAQYGYMLLWVVVASNLIAMLIQTLSAKLGLATGHNLAEICRMHYPRPMAWVMWVLMEIVAMGLDPTRTLVISQVVLSFGLPFAVIPLVQFTRRKDIMGDLVNRRGTTLLAWAVAALIVALNLYLLYCFFGEGS